MKWRIFTLSMLLALSFVLAFAVSASADEPQPFEYAMTRCSGLGSVIDVQNARQRFDTLYGYQHQLKTDADWQWSYVARVNEFAATVGCPSPLNSDGTKSGALTFPYRVYVPWYLFYAHKIEMQ